LAPFTLIAVERIRNGSRVEPALSLLLLCIAVFGIAFIPAGKMGGWIGNSVVFTWVACIPMSVIIMAVVSRGGLAAPSAAAFALLLGLVPALLEQGNEKHLQNIVPGDGDAKVRQLLIRISPETKGDVWTTTWPLID
jgi:hypothetical protein